MNGLEAARVLRQMMPHVLLIIYSSSPNEVSQKVATSIGISGLVSKSDRVSILMDTVRGVLYREADRKAA
jgi:DNA-binding NarL/FixJ family response regulator